MDSKYVAIAVTTECNLKCPYCQSTGESIPNVQGMWNYNRLKEVITAFLEVGYRNFRITGGEPTTVPYLGKFQSDFWNNNYFELNKLCIPLAKISSDFRTNMIKVGTGIPMSGYSLGNGHWLQIKDSSKEPYYALVCNNCPYKDNCIEGVFSLSLSVGEVLRVANCVNQNYWIKLIGLKQRQIKEELRKMENLFFSKKRG